MLSRFLQRAFKQRSVCLESATARPLLPLSPFEIKSARNPDVGVSACDPLPKTTDNALQQRLEKGENDVAALQQQLAELKQERERGVGQSRKSDTRCQDSTGGFDLGVLTLQLSHVKPYANGRKVTLRGKMSEALIQR
jgi:hypothetical protein